VATSDDDDEQIQTFTDELGGTTTVTPPAMARRLSELRALLVPDHNCTGAGGIGTRPDGSTVSYSRPCSGCERQRKRVFAQLGMTTAPKTDAWVYCRCTTPPVYHSPRDPQCDNCHAALATAAGRTCAGYTPMEAPSDAE